MIPIHIKLLAKLIPVLKWKDMQNLAKGEIEKINFVKGCRGGKTFNQQFVGNVDGYDIIWRHIANDYFKIVGKSPEARC